MRLPGPSIGRGEAIHVDRWRGFLRFAQLPGEADDLVQLETRLLAGPLGLFAQRLLHQVLPRVVILHAAVLEELGNPAGIQFVFSGLL